MELIRATIFDGERVGPEAAIVVERVIFIKQGNYDQRRGRWRTNWHFADGVEDRERGLATDMDYEEACRLLQAL